MSCRPIFVLIPTPTTTAAYDYDATCSTLSSTTGATTINHYDACNSSINTGKNPAIYNYDDICDLHQAESSFNNKATYADSKVYYYGYRYYSPELGRWPSRDPKVEEGGINLYAALLNDPQNQQDTHGRQSVSSPWTIEDDTKGIYEGCLSDNSVWCPMGRQGSFSLIMLVGELEVKVGIDASVDKKLPREFEDPEWPGEPDPEEDSYVGAHIDFKFTVREQAHLDMCCCKKGAEVAWRQYYREKGDLRWNLDNNDYWYKTGPQMDNTPGVDGTASPPIKYRGNWPPDTEFRAELHCKNIPPSRPASVYTEKLLGTLYWSVEWSKDEEDKYKGTLSWIW